MSPSGAVGCPCDDAAGRRDEDAAGTLGVGGRFISGADVCCAAVEADAVDEAAGGCPIGFGAGGGGAVVRDILVSVTVAALPAEA